MTVAVATEIRGAGSRTRVKAGPDARLDAGRDSRRRDAGVRTVILVSADARLRERWASSLTGLRWRVREANGGAQAMLHLDAYGAEAMLVDHWLPDLEAVHFAAHVRLLYPEMDLLRDGAVSDEGDGEAAHRSGRARRARSPRRNELLHAMREARDEVGARRGPEAYRVAADGTVTDGSLSAGWVEEAGAIVREVADWPEQAESLPELIGGSEVMHELARLVRLVAPRLTTVLIEGETGTGKELVARALHRLSARARKPFAVLNCAAIPESLLEAELFGHSRGAFTGAVHSRVGRIAMADGGTLLLDEIGEMPVGMQSKMLRFLESGELQRVGDNEMTRVDVRLIAATHQPLEQRSAEGTFRLDLYHRLAVFPIEVPPLRERMGDIDELAEHFLQRLGRQGPRKRLSAGAAARLQNHAWPGNVRELMHVLERAAILAGANAEIAETDIRYRMKQRG